MTVADLPKHGMLGFTECDFLDKIVYGKSGIQQSKLCAQKILLDYRKKYKGKTSTVMFFLFNVMSVYTEHK